MYDITRTSSSSCAVQYHLFSNAASLSQQTIGPTVEVAAFKVVHPIAPNPNTSNQSTPWQFLSKDTVSYGILVSVKDLLQTHCDEAKHYGPLGNLNTRLIIFIKHLI